MRAWKLLLLAVPAIVISSASAGDVTLRNASGEKLSVGLFSGQAGWQLFAGGRRARSLQDGEEGTIPNVNQGVYDITARVGDVQLSQQVRINAGANRFKLSILRQGRPGMVAKPKLRVTRLKPEPGAAAGANGEVFVPHMGIYYKPVQREDGTFVAELTRDAVAGSAAAMIRVQGDPRVLRLEKGDTILELDGQVFRSAEDFRNHRYGTTIEFVDRNTGNRMSCSFILP